MTRILPKSESFWYVLVHSELDVRPENFGVFPCLFLLITGRFQVPVLHKSKFVLRIQLIDDIPCITQWHRKDRAGVDVHPGEWNKWKWGGGGWETRYCKVNIRRHVAIIAKRNSA